MTMKIQYTFYFVVILAFLQNGIGTALEIEVDPETFNEVVSDELTISCTLNGSTPMLKQVVMLEIYKKDKSPLAIIRQDEIITGPGLKANMKATGYIDKTTRSSYLTLTISNPDIEDAGTYSCVLFYLDDFYHLKESKVYGTASVTVDQTDITAVVTYLMGKVSVLDKNSKAQGKVDAEQRDTIQEQAKQIQEQQDLLKKQMAKDKNHEVSLNLLRDKLADQKDKIEEQELKLMQQNESMEEQQRKIDDQERQLMQHEDYMRQQDANATYVSAFSYSYNYADTFEAGDTLLFRDPIMNVGNNYNSTSGIFTAPRSGLYSFHLTGMTYTNGVNVFIDLKVKSNIVASLFVYDGNSNSQSSVSSVASLEAGDKVWPVVKSVSSGSYLYAASYYSVFTGYLLRLS